MNLGYLVFVLILCDLTDASPAGKVCPEQLPEVANATVSQNSLKNTYTEGDELRYMCMPGFTPQGRISFTCERQQWIKTNRGHCSPRRCELPEDIPNGQYRIIHGTDFVIGATIKYTCNEGYNMMSRVDIRTCLIEGWDNRLPQCEEIRCSVEKTDDHLVISGQPYDDSPLKYGQRLQFDCDDPTLGLRGATEVSCSTGGKWSSPFPTCEEVVCIPEKRNNVRILGGSQNEAKPGEARSFSCKDPNMILRGEAKVICTRSGRWNHPFPTCEEKRRCSLPPTAESADVIDFVKDQYEDGERVTYKCKTYYKISGNPYMTCSDGQWTGTIRCMKPCTVTTEEMDKNKIHLAHGRQRKMYSEHLDFISFKCNWWKSLQTGSPGLRQQCIDGVMPLPRCA